MKLVIISDTHMQENKVKVPECDILIHAGDYDIRTLNHLEQLNDWFYNQPAKHKICIAGNHDFYIQRIGKEKVKQIFTNAIYLEDEVITIEGIKFYGSPWTPIFNDWAFMAGVEKLKERASNIPENIDIVITHGPPLDILDYTLDGLNVGEYYLRKRIKDIKPKYHIFGHIHEARGVYQDQYTTYMNVSLVDECYDLIYKPMVINYEKDYSKRT